MALRVAAALVLAVCAPCTFAQWPAKPIRMLAPRLSEATGQQITATTPEQLAQIMHGESRMRAQVISEAIIRPE